MDLPSHEKDALLRWAWRERDRAFRRKVSFVPAEQPAGRSRSRLRASRPVPFNRYGPVDQRPRRSPFQTSEAEDTTITPFQPHLHPVTDEPLEHPHCSCSPRDSRTTVATPRGRDRRRGFAHARQEIDMTTRRGRPAGGRFAQLRPGSAIDAREHVAASRPRSPRSAPGASPPRRSYDRRSYDRGHLKHPARDDVRERTP